VTLTLVEAIRLTPRGKSIFVDQQVPGVTVEDDDGAAPPATRVATAVN
jgi:hypothetical protein